MFSKITRNQAHTVDLKRKKTTMRHKNLSITNAPPSINFPLYTLSQHIPSIAPYTIKTLNIPCHQAGLCLQLRPSRLAHADGRLRRHLEAQIAVEIRDSRTEHSGGRGDRPPGRPPGLGPRQPGPAAGPAGPGGPEAGRGALAPATAHLRQPVGCRVARLARRVGQQVGRRAVEHEVRQARRRRGEGRRRGTSPGATGTAGGGCGGVGSDGAGAAGGEETTRREAGTFGGRGAAGAAAGGAADGTGVGLWAGREDGGTRALARAGRPGDQGAGCWNEGFFFFRYLVDTGILRAFLKFFNL